MKKDIHPKLNKVIFKDISCGFQILTSSTLTSNEKAVWEDGKEYPVIGLEISSASHPFFTGKQRVLDTEGRVDRFKRRYAGLGGGDKKSSADLQTNQGTEKEAKSEQKTSAVKSEAKPKVASSNAKSSQTAKANSTKKDEKTASATGKVKKSDDKKSTASKSAKTSKE